MATIYGTPTQGKFLGGEGGLYEVDGRQYNSPTVYEYGGKYYEPHQGGLNWARQVVESRGGVGPGEAETMFGPGQNPGMVESISQQLGGFVGTELGYVSGVEGADVGIGFGYGIGEGYGYGETEGA
jgi:hypothetical protein